MVSRMSIGWLTLSTRHEFRQRDTQPGSGPAGTAKHGGQLSVRIPARRGDIEVRPGLPARELADEHASQYGASLPVLGVAQVCDLAAQKDAVIGEDRQPPDAISGIDGSLLDHGPESVVVADPRRSGMPDGDFR